MATRTIVSEMIGIIPASKGDWVSGTAYAQDNQVKMYNCVLSSKHDNNTTTPMTWDGAETFTFNTEHWDVVMDGTAQFLADKDKPATTGTTGDYPYNGMGRVELAKNMVNTGTELEPVMVNTLTQDMFYKGAVGSRVPNTNTIFVIRYDYVLAENITIPDGCVLEFEGGSISGAYTITGANTSINAGMVKIFGTDVTIAGTWNVEGVYPEWFGALRDTDSTLAIQKAIDVISTNNNIYPLLYLYGRYLVSSPIVINQRRIKIKGNRNKYDELYTLKASDNFTPATIDTKVVKAVLALTKPIDIKSISINGNKKANCIQWYAGWASGIVEDCELSNAIGAGIAGSTCEKFVIKSNYIHENPIGIRFSLYYFTVAQYKDYNIFKQQASNPVIGSSYMLDIVENNIQNQGMNVYIDSGSCINIINNLSGHAQIFGINIWNAKNINIDGNYTEGDGVCVGDGFTTISGTEPVGDTNQALIDNDLDGFHQRRSVILLYACLGVNISNTNFNYKKRGGISTVSPVSTDRTKAGIDSFVDDYYCTDVSISTVGYYNWNGGNSDAIVPDIELMNERIPSVNVQTLNLNPIYRGYFHDTWVEVCEYINVKNEHIGNIVDFTDSKWCTYLNYEPSTYTLPFSDMPVTLSKKIGSVEYYAFNSRSAEAHFHIDPSALYRKHNNYIAIFLPILNGSNDNSITFICTQYGTSDGVLTSEFKTVTTNNGMMMVGILPIRNDCTHMDFALYIRGNGADYSNILFGLPKINYLGVNDY